MGGCCTSSNPKSTKQKSKSLDQRRPIQQVADSKESNNDRNQQSLNQSGNGDIRLSQSNQAKQGEELLVNQRGGGSSRRQSQGQSVQNQNLNEDDIKLPVEAEQESKSKKIK